MAESNNIETEMKLLTFSNDALDKVLVLDFVKEKIVVDSVKTKQLESHYYDTVSRKLAKNGIVYRVRKEPEGFVATVKLEKSNSGGLSDRTEYNVPVPSVKPEFSSMQEYIDLTSVAENETVEELFSVIVTRRQCNLQLTDATTVELAVDVGEIIAGAKKMPVAELELEIVTGNKDNLLKFVSALSKEIPLYAEHLSKFERGTLLLGENMKPKEKVDDTKKQNTNVDRALLLNELFSILGTALYDFTLVKQAEEQNKSAAIKTLYGNWQRFKSLFEFCKPLFVKTDYDKNIAVVDFLIKDIRLVAFADKTFVEKSPIWLEKIKQLNTIFDTKLAKGEYTSKAFFLLSWLQKEAISNNEVADDFLQSRTKALVSFLIAMHNEQVKNWAMIMPLTYLLGNSLTLLKKYLPEKLLLVQQTLGVVQKEIATVEKQENVKCFMISLVEEIDDELHNQRDFDQSWSSSITIDNEQIEQSFVKLESLNK